MSIHADMPVAITDHCIDKDRLWMVKDLAKHTGTSAYSTANFMRGLKNLQHCSQVGAASFK
jgi:hypothetical protein